MLAYAANAPRFGERRRSPSALLAIVGLHAVAVGVLMTTKMDLGTNDTFTKTIVDLIKVPPPSPTEAPPPPKSRPMPHNPVSQVDVLKPIVPIDTAGPAFEQTPIDQPPVGPMAGTGTEYIPSPPIQPPVRTAARFNTPEWALRPPYPLSKRNAEEEATLKLRLSIDDRGRVVAVQPVGNADPVFLEAARKHLIAKWRYRPATEDGKAIHSSTVITLRFELEA